MAPTLVAHNYYAILEVESDATIQIIKQSYRRLALARHPDKQPENPNATAEFQTLLEAFETISDQQKREIYDQDYAEQIKQAEEKRRADEQQKAENERRTEKARRAETKRKAEQERKFEEQRKADEEREAELERQAKENRKREEEQDRKAEIAHWRTLESKRARITWWQLEIPKLKQELQVLEGELRVIRGHYHNGVPTKARKLAEDPAVNANDVLSMREKVDEARKMVEVRPTCQTKRQYKGALLKLKTIENLETKNLITYLTGKVDALVWELSQIEERTTMQKRQAWCDFNGWWERCTGLFTCMAKTCGQPGKKTILQCPECGYLLCSKCLRGRKSAGLDKHEQAWIKWQAYIQLRASILSKSAT